MGRLWGLGRRRCGGKVRGKAKACNHFMLDPLPHLCWRIANLIRSQGNSDHAILLPASSGWIPQASQTCFDRNQAGDGSKVAAAGFARLSTAQEKTRACHRCDGKERAGVDPAFSSPAVSKERGHIAERSRGRLMSTLL